MNNNPTDNPAYAFDAIPYGLIRSEAVTYDIVEVTVAECQHYVILDANFRAEEDARRNAVNKFMKITIQQMLKFRGNPTQTCYIVLCQRERMWLAVDIPQNPWDKGAVRFQVWGEILPDPHTHIREVLIRLPWLTNYIPEDILRRWIMRNIRGTPTFRIGLAPQRRCKVCGSFFLGYPLANHEYQQCLFYQYLPCEQLLSWMAINLNSFCSFCTARSSTHVYETDCAPNQKPCEQCHAPGHQVFQKMCGGDKDGQPYTDSKQKDLVRQAREDHYYNIQMLARDGRLRYRIPSDCPDAFIKKHIAKYNIQTSGWGKYEDWSEAYPKSAVHVGLYAIPTIYKGLNNAEESSANVPFQPIFPPGQVDMAKYMSMIVDYLRFQTTEFPNRQGGEPVYITRDLLGHRSRQRTEDPMPVLVPEPPARAIPVERGRAQGHLRRRSAPPPAPARPQTPPSEAEEEPRELQNQRQPEEHRNVWPDRRGLRAPSPGIPGNRLPPPWCEGNPTKQQFHIKDSRWFEINHPTVDMSSGRDPTSIRVEQALLAIANRHDQRTGKLRVHPREFFEISRAPLPNTMRALCHRITLLINALTGLQFTHTSSPNHFSSDIVRDYVVYLQGVFGFIGDLAIEGRALPVQLTDCRYKLFNMQYSHTFFVPNLETYIHGARHEFFVYAEENWHYFGAYYMDPKCDCFEALHLEH